MAGYGYDTPKTLIHAAVIIGDIDIINIVLDVATPSDISNFDGYYGENILTYMLLYSYMPYNKQQENDMKMVNIIKKSIQKAWRSIAKA